jgi:hypothetical protein
MNKKDKSTENNVKESKPKREYFFDFLMLFLAVTLGFFADNYREDLSDKQKEKQNIESIIRTVAGDTLNMQRVINENEFYITGIDSFIALKKLNINSAGFKQKYYYFAFNYLLSEQYYKQNEAGYEQLSTSGVLRLITKDEVVSNLAAYNNSYITDVLSQEVICHELFMQQADLLSKILNLTTMRDPTIPESDMADIHSDLYTSKLEELYKEPLTIKEMYNLAVSLCVSNYVYVYILQHQLERGRNLIDFLKEEYHLEKK